MFSSAVKIWASVFCTRTYFLRRGSL